MSKLGYRRERSTGLLQEERDVDESSTEGAAIPGRRGIVLYRGEGAPGLFESGTMSVPAFDPEDQKSLAALGPRSTNIVLGGHDAVLFRGQDADGYSLVKAWFAPHYVLPRHSHDADCLYYILEGSVVMGAQILSAGDGFFVPAGAPYAYEAGSDGVTVLEFRTRTSFDMTIPGGQVERLTKMGVVADEHAEQWAAWRTAAVGGRVSTGTTSNE
jgi:quercetin dioxygenase-like cupin family protein